MPEAWFGIAIVHAVDVGCFRDGNDDGFGGFRGPAERPDYLFLAFYPSPHRDNGYDVSDHRRGAGRGGQAHG